MERHMVSLEPPSPNRAVGRNPKYGDMILAGISKMIIGLPLFYLFENNFKLNDLLHFTDRFVRKTTLQHLYGQVFLGRRHLVERKALAVVDRKVVKVETFLGVE